jgi:hypothetical protein
MRIYWRGRKFTLQPHKYITNTDIIVHSHEMSKEALTKSYELESNAGAVGTYNYLPNTDFKIEFYT